MPYDPSTDYARYPTLAPLPAGKLSGCGDYVSCSGCGGNNFLLRRKDRKLLCARCGKEMEQQAPNAVPKPAVSPAPVPRKPVRPRIQFSNHGNNLYILDANGSVKALQYNQDSRTFEESTFGKFGECNVQDWSSITAVAAGTRHVVGLRSNGTVLAVGNNHAGECDVQAWTNITAIAAGYERTVGLCADGTVKAAGNKLYGACNVQDWFGVTAIASGGGHTVGLRANGTVKAVGDNRDGQCNVQGWSGITAVAASANHTVGLRSNGTVLAVGRNDYGLCDTQDWTDIIAIATGTLNTVGLCKDGTIRLAGYQHCFNKDALSWRDIVSIQLIYGAIIGMQSDGTYLCTHPNYHKLLKELTRSAPSPEQKTTSAAARKTPALFAQTSSPFFCCTGGKVEAYHYDSGDGSVKTCTDLEFTKGWTGQHDICMVGGWSGITAVAAGGMHTAGLRSDGTVVAVGRNDVGQCNVQSWSRMTAIGTGYHHTVGLRSDGTVLATGRNDDGECNIRGWFGITAIAVGFTRTMGLRADGTVLCAGKDPYGADNVRGWSGITELALGLYHTAGLRRDGTVVVTGRNERGELDDVHNWSGITAIASNLERIVGLHRDGTLRMSGYIGFLEKEILAWHDIVSIQAFGTHIVAMQSDGTYLSNHTEIEKLLNSRFR